MPSLEGARARGESAIDSIRRRLTQQAADEAKAREVIVAHLGRPENQAGDSLTALATAAATAEMAVRSAAASRRAASRFPLCSNRVRSVIGELSWSATESCAIRARSSSTDRAAWSWSVAAWNCQVRIASRIERGSCQSPAAVTTAAYSIRAPVRASRSGTSSGRTTKSCQRSS